MGKDEEIPPMRRVFGFAIPLFSVFFHRLSLLLCRRYKASLLLCLSAWICYLFPSVILFFPLPTTNPQPTYYAVGIVSYFALVDLVTFEDLTGFYAVGIVIYCLTWVKVSPYVTVVD